MSEISRNASCPCGSGQKYKRCHLPVVETAARIQRNDDRVAAQMLEWISATYEDELNAMLSAASEEEDPEHIPDDEYEALINWVMSEADPGDGGARFAERYAAHADTPDADRAVAERIAQAHPGLYRVQSAIPGLWVEVEPFTGGESRQVMSAYVSKDLEPGDLLLGRLVRAEKLTTFWGLVRPISSDLDAERKWTTFLTDHDLTSSDGALAAFSYVHEEWALAIPESVGALHTVEWAVTDDLQVDDDLAGSDQLVELGMEPELSDEVWAYAWLGEARPGIVDLGGVSDEPGQIEVARLRLSDDALTLLSPSESLLSEVAGWVEANVTGLSAQEG